MTRRLLLAGLAVAACASAQNELRFAIRSEPKTLHPALAADDSSETVRYLTAGVLIRVNRETQQLEPELATSWKIGAGGRSMTLRLREGVRFSDGTPFTAADVAHTFHTLMNPELRAPGADAFRTGKGDVSAAVNGKHEVTLTFPAPVAGLERLFDGLAILSAVSPLKERAVLGPFLLAEHKPGAYLLLRRNPHYWKSDRQGRRLPYLDAVRLEIQQNRELELMRFERGQLHLVTALDAEHFDRLSARAPARVKDAGPGMEAELMWFNQAARAQIPAHKLAWFRSAGFRRAVSEAIQREDLCRVVFRGRARPAAGPLSPANQFWFNARLKPHAYDPAGALRRLAAEGFRKQGEWLRDGAGNQVEFSLITNAGNRARERMGAMIQEDLKKIGIRLNVVTLDFPSLIERISRTFQYEACLLGLVNVDLDPNAQMNVWLSSAAQHQWNPSQSSPATPWEAELDKLMHAQASTLDPKKRKVHFDRVQEIVWEQAPFLYLVNKNALVAFQPFLGNVSPVALRPQLYWNVEWLRLDGEQRAGVRR